MCVEIVKFVRGDSAREAVKGATVQNRALQFSARLVSRGCRRLPEVNAPASELLAPAALLRTFCGPRSDTSSAADTQRDERSRARLATADRQWRPFCVRAKCAVEVQSRSACA